MRKGTIWKAVSAGLLLLLVLGLVVARERYLKKVLSDEEIKDTRPFETKIVSSMSLRTLKQDQFVNLTKQGMQYYYWELNSVEHDLYARYYELGISSPDRFDEKGQMQKLVTTMWEADSSVTKTISERIYMDKGRTKFEGHYLVGLYEQRVLMLCQETNGKAMLLVTLGMPYAWPIQDTMINTAEFR